MGMPRQTSGLRRRRTALFAIAVWILMTGGAESDVVERVNDLRGSTSSQDLVPPLEGSSTADLQQVVGAPKDHDLGSAGADPVQLQSEGVAESDLVEGGTELAGSMLNQEQVFPRKRTPCSVNKGAPHLKTQANLAKAKADDKLDDQRVAKLQADLGKAAKEATELKAQLAAAKAQCTKAGTTPSGNFPTVTSANRAGNNEEELGEEDD